MSRGRQFQWATAVAMLIALFFALRLVWSGLEGQGLIGDRVERCEAAGGTWLQASDGWGCFRVERIDVP